MVCPISIIQLLVTVLAFPTAAAHTWTDLAYHVTVVFTLPVFKTCLKINLYQLSFPQILYGVHLLLPSVTMLLLLHHCHNSQLTAGKLRFFSRFPSY